MNAVKRVFGTLHLWFGVIFGIPAAILGATGIWLMMVHPLPKVVDAEPIMGGIDALIAVARTAAPEGAIPQQYIAPVDAHEPATFRFAPARSSESGPRNAITVLVDPTTAKIVPQDEHARSPIERIVHDLHGNFLGGRDGREVVAWAGIAMALLGMTGLVLWLPREGQWKRAFLLSTSGSPRKVLRDLHGAAGIWGLVVFLVVTVTGVLIVYPIGGRPAGVPGAPGAQRERGGAAIEAYQVDAAIALVRTARPDVVVRNVALPRTANDPYRINLGIRGADRNDIPTVATVDSGATKLISIRAPSDMSATELTGQWVRALHMGRGGGWIWWTLVTLSGALPVIFCVSGIWMWLLKRRNRAAVQTQAATQASPS